MAHATKPISPTYGLLARYDEPEQLVAAAAAARAAGYTRVEAYTPFPVHGLDDSVGHKPTKLPWIVFLAGAAGALGGFMLQYITSTNFDLGYPVNTGGKPFNSWPAFIVITFECTILAAGLTSAIAMIALNGLPQPHHPLFNVPEFDEATQTKFFLCIEQTDPKFSLTETRTFLAGTGATGVFDVPNSPRKVQTNVTAPPPPHEVVPGAGPGAGWPARSHLLMLAITLVGILLGAAGCDNVNFQMDDESRLEVYEPSPFFADNQSVRPIVEGTVARGQARLDDHFYTGKVNGKDVTEFPMPVTRRMLERGRQRYEIYCTPCHNWTGDGNGMIVQRGFVRPPNLHDQRLKDAPVGHFYDVIANGWGAMYSYGDRINPEDRWAITAYIRVLQLSQGAELASLPQPIRDEYETQRQNDAKRTPTPAGNIDPDGVTQRQGSEEVHQ